MGSLCIPYVENHTSKFIQNGVTSLLMTPWKGRTAAGFKARYASVFYMTEYRLLRV